MKFAQDPTITMEAWASSQYFSDVLFTVTPTDEKSFYTSRVTTLYLRGLVMEETAKLNARHNSATSEREVECEEGG